MSTRSHRLVRSLMIACTLLACAYMLARATTCWIATTRFRVKPPTRLVRTSAFGEDPPTTVMAERILASGLFAAPHEPAPSVTLPTSGSRCERMHLVATAVPLGTRPALALVNIEGRVELLSSGGPSSHELSILEIGVERVRLRSQTGDVCDLSMRVRGRATKG